MASSIHYDIRCVLLLHLATSSLSSSSSPSTLFRVRTFSNDEAKEAVKLPEKPSICTADELHYVSVPNSDWRHALWRYLLCPTAAAFLSLGIAATRCCVLFSSSLRVSEIEGFYSSSSIWGYGKGHLRHPIPLPCILQLMVPALEPFQHPLLLRWWIKVINKELQHCLVGL